MKLGNLELFITEETENKTAQVTSKPVESGVDISDNININPLGFSLSVNVSSNGKAISDQISLLIESKEPLLYEGVEANHENMIITSISKTRNSSITDGFEGSITIQQLEITEQTAATVITLGVDPFTNIQVQTDNIEIEKRELQTQNLEPEVLFGRARGVL